MSLKIRIEIENNNFFFKNIKLAIDDDVVFL